jgi:hypothetical protein
MVEIELRGVVANMDPVAIQAAWARATYAVTVKGEYGTAAWVLERDPARAEQAFPETRIAAEPETTSEVSAPSQERLNPIVTQVRDEYASAPFGLSRERGFHCYRLARTEARDVDVDDACMDRSGVS